MQLGKYAHLGPQQLWNDGHRDVIHRAALISLDAIQIRQMYCRDEDDGRLLEARMLVHHIRQLEAIDLRHADVHQHHSDIMTEQHVQSLAGRPGLDQVLTKIAKNGFVAEQFSWLIIHHEYVCLVVPVHLLLLSHSYCGNRSAHDHVRSADARIYSLPVKPHP